MTILTSDVNPDAYPVHPQFVRITRTTRPAPTGNEVADPRSMSIERSEVEYDLILVDDARAGPREVTQRAYLYLPKYASEEVQDYQARLQSAPWRPVYKDVLTRIIDRPFGKRVRLTPPDGAQELSDEMRQFQDDVDTLGSNIHVFAKSAFAAGVHGGQCVILTEFPVMPEGLTAAEERALNPRPYWVLIPHRRIIAIRTAIRHGRTVITELRFSEWVTEKNGFYEFPVEQVREITPETIRVWRFELGTANETKVVLFSETPNKAGEVRAVVFAPEDVDETQVHRPVLLQIAQMQMELFRALSRNDEVMTFAGSPMLSASGMKPPEPTRLQDGTMADAPRVRVGPRVVLYAPPPFGEGMGTPKWEFIQPSAQNIEVLNKHAMDIEADMRQMGRQPFIRKQGNSVAAEVQADSRGADTPVESWALRLKDSLEQSLIYVRRWQDASGPGAPVTDLPGVLINTSFGSVIEVGAGDTADLLALREAGEISQETLWEEMERRGKLGNTFDPEEERRRLETTPPTFKQKIALSEQDLAKQTLDNGQKNAEASHELAKKAAAKPAVDDGSDPSGSGNEGGA
jgi:hypothetical protein